MEGFDVGVGGTILPSAFRHMHFRSIVDPNPPEWIRPYLGPRGLVTKQGVGQLSAILAVAVAMLWAAVVGGGSSITFVPSILAAVTFVVVPLVVEFIKPRHMVSGSNPAFDGTPIVGVGLDLLTDISARFLWAERNIDGLPDLVQWSELESHVESIRWDAARHAAALTETDKDWNSVIHAPAGSPQEVLKTRLGRERQDHLSILNGYQLTADRLMNHAGNALAAAKIAEREGYDLDVVAPSHDATEAREKLDAVIERLDALTAAWRELDSSTELLAADLDMDAGTQQASARAKQLRAEIERSIPGTEPEAGS